jgi:hypothetical protein
MIFKSGKMDKIAITNERGHSVSDSLIGIGNNTAHQGPYLIQAKLYFLRECRYVFVDSGWLVHIRRCMDKYNVAKIQFKLYMVIKNARRMVNMQLL